MYRCGSDEEKLQLCAPLEYRKEIISLCHEEVSGHLGTTKTKNRVLRCYFWPNSGKEFEDFVKTLGSLSLKLEEQKSKKTTLKLYQ